MSLTLPLNAELYRLTHRGSPGDVAFYTALCEPAASVLELGAGYGRLVSALSRPGRQLVGLEKDLGLLGLARKQARVLPDAARRGVRLVAGDMRDFSLGRRFDRVLLPYNGLYCLLNQREAKRCFSSVRRALTPDGVFAFDIWTADAFHEPSDSTAVDEAEPLFSVAHRGKRYRVFESSTVNKTRQRLDVRYTYVPEGRGTSHSMLLRQRYFRSAEVVRLLEQQGFRVEKRYGNFKHSRFTARSPQLILLAKLS